RVDELLANPSEAARWFYAHQSRERRFHLANRLFLVLWDPQYPEESWRLQADVAALRASINGFLADPRYVDVTLPDPSGQSSHALAAVIPVHPGPVPRQLRLDLSAPPPRVGKLSRSSLAPRQLRLPDA
ncbi:MAG: hypothetical protein ACRDIY_00275, partial [Chloroflexota bacterium]